MRTQLDVLLSSLILALTSLRSPESDSQASLWSTYGRARGFIDSAATLDLITHEQWLALCELLSSAFSYSGKPFPDPRNLGPVMPYALGLVRAKQAVKPQAQVPAHDEQVSAPAPRRELRLLCLLVPSRTGKPRFLPVHTVRAMPPRRCVQGRWNLSSDAGFHLRETQARAPTPEVLELCVRQRPAHALRACS